MEINKKHTLFGDRAQRISTSDVRLVWVEIYDAIFDSLERPFRAVSLTKSLPCKTEHGDVDIVYIPSDETPIDRGVKGVFGESVLDTHKNGDVYSILYRSSVLNKDIHVDFIRANETTYKTKLQYFSYNDFSGVFGMLSKKYHFKYGSEGFFKRYCDSKGNWHDIFVTSDLTVGMELLGYDSRDWEKLETYDDIINFMVSSPMFDYRLFIHDSLNQSDKKSYKRPVIKYVVDGLRASGKTATITDEDHFLKRTIAHHMCEMKMWEIEERIKERALDRERRLNDNQG